MRGRLGRRLLPILLAASVVVLTLALVEGLSSLALVVYGAAVGTNPTLATHMQPDTLVGWVNIPNIRLPNLYGPGLHLNVNSQSFRGREEYEPEIPAGRLRVLCSGDSFTFGVGVADHQSWCAELQRQDERLQTVNLGHAGWGIDQAYLFYQRDGLKLKHDVHIFALIPDDFNRLRLAQYRGYPKPLYRFRNGQLILTNVPLHRPSRLALWWHSSGFEQLRVVELGTKLLGRAFGRQRIDRAVNRTEARDVLLRLFEDLQRQGEQAGNTFVVVLLEEDLTTNQQEQWLVHFLATELAKREIPFIDLWSEFRRQPADRVAPLFDARWKHYSERGNALVAATIYRRLQALPKLTSRLKRVGAAAGVPAP